MVVAVAVAVAVREEPPARGKLCGAGEKLLEEGDQGGPAHQEAPRQQDATDAQRAQALNLAVATGEAVGRRLGRPAHGREGHDVADEVGQTVDGVGDECWCVSVPVVAGPVQRASPWLLKT